MANWEPLQTADRWCSTQPADGLRFASSILRDRSEWEPPLKPGKDMGFQLLLKHGRKWERLGFRLTRQQREKTLRPHVARLLPA